MKYLNHPFRLSNKLVMFGSVWRVRVRLSHSFTPDALLFAYFVLSSVNEPLNRIQALITIHSALKTTIKIGRGSHFAKNLSEMASFLHDLRR